MSEQLASESTYITRNLGHIVISVRALVLPTARTKDKRICCLDRPVFVSQSPSAGGSVDLPWIMHCHVLVFASVDRNVAA